MMGWRVGRRSGCGRCLLLQGWRGGRCWTSCHVACQLHVFNACGGQLVYHVSSSILLYRHSSLPSSNTHYCVTARRPCNTNPNMTPRATLGSWRQSNTLPNASPDAACPMTLVSALGIPRSTNSFLALILNLSFSSSPGASGHFFSSSSVGSAFSLIFLSWLAKPSSEVEESRVSWSRVVMDASCGFPGRKRNVFAALSSVRRRVQAEERV